MIRLANTLTGAGVPWSRSPPVWVHASRTPAGGGCPEGLQHPVSTCPSHILFGGRHQPCKGLRSYEWVMFDCLTLVLVTEKPQCMVERRFFMLRGDPTVTLPALVQDTGAALLVTDFGPLRLGREWRSKVSLSKEQASQCSGRNRATSVSSLVLYQVGLKGSTLSRYTFARCQH